MPICSKNVTMGIEGFFYTLKNWGKTLYLIQRERYLSKRRTIFPLKRSNIVFGSRPKKKVSSGSSCTSSLFSSGATNLSSLPIQLNIVRSAAPVTSNEFRGFTVIFVTAAVRALIARSIPDNDIRPFNHTRSVPALSNSFCSSNILASKSYTEILLSSSKVTRRDMGPNVACSIQAEDEEPKIASKTAYKQY
ncbi:hypothetical protein GQX74_004945 [Glossina fuscipes]|nr:hypothetical protein GQX74_004945 [Glossina fuscipes]